MRIPDFKALLVITTTLLLIPAALAGQSSIRLEKLGAARLKEWKNPVKEWNALAKVRVDSLKVSGEERSVKIFFPVSFSYIPFRENELSLFEKSVRDCLGRKFSNYKIEFYTNGFTPDELVPNYFRSPGARDTNRIPEYENDRPVLIRKLNSFVPLKGLADQNIALWHSHGYYYDISMDRWEWQRAKLFGTVEDISVMGYVLPYLSTILENAGATVFIPRERDIQVNEIIVDNDISSPGSEFVLHPGGSQQKLDCGFLKCDTLFTGDNPFRKGTSLRAARCVAEYIPDFPESGDYSVYVSYPYAKDNGKAVKYSVRHSGGTTEFIIDQTIGGGTWVWLGSFRFNKGKNNSSGEVVVCSDNDDVIALDAVRFGGGMGNVARRPALMVLANQRSVNEDEKQLVKPSGNDAVTYAWKVSGKPRFMEGARYYLQYAGMPDTLVYSLNKNMNDYNDDYQSRGVWVNYLTGKTDDPLTPGLGIPVDLALAFHSDAGITPDDSIIGTLGIYSTASGNGRFPDGTSRMASRDLADLIQTQIVNDIAATFNPEWTRRGLWDRPYSEARKPDVPVMLLELLSHQNQGDQMFGLDPRFRFAVSRAIYKGMLRFLSFNQERDYVVQPLPVNSMAIKHLGGRKIRLSWNASPDPLESTAVPSGYRIYMREEGKGFDNGFDVREPFVDIVLPHYDTIYSFKVTATNDGGESFGSEILAAGLKAESEKDVLVVNGFDRVSGPSWFDRAGMAGVSWWNDRGVADRYDIVATGDQYDFDRSSPWLDDDAPGWGASYSDLEGKIIAGNTFDYTYIHGRAIMAAGRSFVSVSDEVFTSEDFDPSAYKAVDFIFGEEKTTPAVHDTSKVDFSIYTPSFMSKMEKVAASGIPVFMSGAYVGTDLEMTGDTALLAAIGKYLHFKPRTGHAVKNGYFYSTDIAQHFLKIKSEFNTGTSGLVYGAEAPDAIEPADKNSVTALRYTENNTSAAVTGKGINKTVVFGFPFETVTSEADRYYLMKQILEYLITQ